MCNQILVQKQIVENVRENKHRVNVCFVNLKKGYDRVNREALGNVLRMYDVGGRLLNGT